jgi:hypothetical protein
MISGRLEWIWKIFEDASAVMFDRRSFSMHQTRGQNDFAAENSPDALMTETNAEDRHFRSQDADDLVANASVFRTAWSRRNTDPVGRERFGFGDSDLVVPLHNDIATKHAEILDEIVGKRVVVIDDQNLFIHRLPG